MWRPILVIDVTNRDWVITPLDEFLETQKEKKEIEMVEKEIEMVVMNRVNGHYEKGVVLFHGVM